MLVKFCFIYAITNKQEIPFIYYQVGGVAGGIWWGTMKKYVFKREIKRKNVGLKRGGQPKISSNFAVTAFVVMQTA